MSNTDSDLLTKISKSCFFRLQPQPLVDLLNSRGIVGRPAEVFWTYFHWGFQNGSFRCQLSSSYIAEALFTDVRTVQRANERLLDAGLITRTRAKRISGTHLEAPAITTIAIPDAEVRQMLETAPTRHSGGSEGSEIQHSPDGTPGAASKPVKLGTQVTNKQSHNDEPHNESPAPAAIELCPTLKSDKQDANDEKPISPTAAPCPTLVSAVKDRKEASASFQKIKQALPKELQQLHDKCLLKARPEVFKQALDEVGGIPENEADVLMEPLVQAQACKTRDLSATQNQKTKGVSDKPKSISQKKSKACDRPEDPRPIPEKLIAFIERRLNANADSMPVSDRSRLLKEIVYSITIGTLRGLDVMHAINTTIKLVSTRKWSKPLGMPEGWSYSHVLVSNGCAA